MITNPPRRERLIFVPYDEVLNCLFPAINPDDIFVLRAAGMPSTAKVVRVWEDARRASFVFVFEDASFDAVPAGHYAPQLDITMERIKLDRKPDPVLEDPAQTKLSLG